MFEEIKVQYRTLFWIIPLTIAVFYFVKYFLRTNFSFVNFSFSGDVISLSILIGVVTGVTLFVGYIFEKQNKEA